MVCSHCPTLTQIWPLPTLTPTQWVWNPIAYVSVTVSVSASMNTSTQFFTTHFFYRYRCRLVWTHHYSYINANVNMIQKYLRIIWSMIRILLNLRHHVWLHLGHGNERDEIGWRLMKMYEALMSLSSLHNNWRNLRSYIYSQFEMSGVNTMSMTKSAVPALVQLSLLRRCANFTRLVHVLQNIYPDVTIKSET